MLYTGILWHDSSDDALSEKMKPALARFQSRFGERPTRVAVNPSEKDKTLEGIDVVESNRVLQYHYFLVCGSGADE